MTKPRPEKKSESLEVRLPYSVKTRFMSAVKTNDETASEAVRAFIDAYLVGKQGPGTSDMSSDTPLTHARNRRTSFALAASAAAAMAFSSLPVAASEIAHAPGDGPPRGTVASTQSGEDLARRLRASISSVLPGTSASQLDEIIARAQLTQIE